MSFKRLLAAGCAAFTLAALPAHAFNVTATAGQNPFGYLTETDPLAFTSVGWPDGGSAKAFASASRSEVRSQTIGYDTAPPGSYFASATSFSSYTLWDVAGNRALDGGTAAGLTLNFNFGLWGGTYVERASLSVGTMTYDAELYSGTIAQRAGGISVAYGPIPPFPDEGYVITGDTELNGGYNIGFSLQHQHAAGGLMWLATATTASNQADTFARLSLVSITLALGDAPLGGLAVRIDETGLLIPVLAAVPEAPTWLMWLGALAAAGTVRRRVQARSSSR